MAEKEKSLHSHDRVLGEGAPFSKGRIKLSTEPYKGVRDFYPEEMEVQKYIFSVWRKVAEQFGYVEYSASLLESSELYRIKGNEEIVNEQTYSFIDRGGREVTLRPEMTPTLARMVAARRKSLKFPLRWYSIPNVFRYERPQRGRRREHWQLNADLMGIAGVEAEAEIISLADKIMKAFGAKDEDFRIQIGNRKWVEFLTEELGADGKSEEKKRKLFRLLDIQTKQPAEFLRGLEELGISPSALSPERITPEVRKKIGIDELLAKLETMNIKNVSFDPAIVRGFDYYTGMVFEVFDADPENRRSLFGGGRYDNLLELFGVEPVPTVGFGMGDITIRDFLETHKLPLK